MGMVLDEGANLENASLADLRGPKARCIFEVSTLSYLLFRASLIPMMERRSVRERQNQSALASARWRR